MLEMTTNIEKGNPPVSSIYGSLYNYFDLGYQRENAETLCKAELGAVNNEARNIFHEHKYYIACLAAFFSKFIEVRLFYNIATVFSFFLVLYLSYRLLRENKVSILNSILLMTLILVHPAFSMSLIGQIYYERFFVPLAFCFYIF